MAMTQFCVCFLLCSTLFFEHVRPEAFSSTTSLQQLVSSEGFMLRALENYVTQEEVRLNELRSKIQKLRSNPPQYLDSAELEYAGHPINAYQLIKMWHGFTADVHMKPHTNINSLINRLTTAGIQFPAFGDLEGAVRAVVRLQNTYKLSTESLANGTINGYQARTPLNADDFYRFGVEAISNSDTGIGAQWLQKAVEARQEDSNFLESDALLRLSSANRMIGDYEEAARIVTIAYDKHGENYTVRNSYDDTVRLWNQINQGQKYESHFNISTYEKWLPSTKKSYVALCRGEKEPRDPEVLSSLVCRYRIAEVPIMRYKEEVQSYDPYISLIYDIITDKQATLIKNLATPSMIRATVGDPSKSEQSNERVSKVAWLWDDPGITGGYAQIRYLSETVYRITGLTTEYRTVYSSAEPFQVVNYGIGGQYEPHHDYYEDKSMLNKVPYFIQGTGDRIATFMFYLSQPVAGGATVFPRVGVTVPAVKYGAAFWYNIKRSGELDERTEHAGCPVLLGQKWIANKWIREYGQEFRRPCGMTPDATDLL